MRRVTKQLTVLLLACSGLFVMELVTVDARLPQRSSPAPARRPAFEVVSIRRNMTNDVASNIIERSDGGFTMLNVPTTALLARAYAPAIIDIANVPRWVAAERYDVTVTSPLPNATGAQRREMLQAMLADRFKLTVHTEMRDEASYDLVMARADRRLGPDIKPAAIDCDAKPTDGRSAQGNAPAGRGRPARGSLATAGASCVLLVNRDRIDGDATMAGLADMLRGAAARPIVDKTGLKGSYHISMMPDASTPASGDLPPLLSALESRLGLKLVPSMTKGDVVVIDRIERPGE
jgi:uncharacterized protein (TIGR03435 family)